MPALYLRKVIHPQAHDNHRVLSWPASCVGLVVVSATALLATTSVRSAGAKALSANELSAFVARQTAIAWNAGSSCHYVARYRGAWRSSRINPQREYQA